MTKTNHFLSVRNAFVAISLFVFMAGAVVAQEPAPVAEVTTDVTAEAVDSPEAVAETVDPAVEQISEQLEQIALQAHAGEDRNVAVGRTVLLDASASTGPTGSELTYVWDLGDGTAASGIDATKVYEDSGIYKVTLTVSAVVDGEAQESQDSIIVSVQDTLVTLIVDQTITNEEVEELQAYGLTQGVLVIPIRDSGVNQEYLTVQNLAQKMLKNQENIIASDIIITWTSGNIGLTSLIELSRIASANNISLDEFRFGSKAIVAINNNQSLNSSAKTAQTTFQTIRPEYIIVGERPIADEVIRAGTSDALQQALPSMKGDYQLITEYTARGLQQLGPWNFMSYAMNFMINRGVPVSSLYLVLMLPVIATIIAAARQVVGIKSFGIFAPTVIALSFLATGLKYGVTVFIVIIILGTAARLMARRFRLLYLPRMALVLSLLAFAIFVMFLVGSYFNKTGFIAISIFPILIMTVLTEHFLTVQIEHGYQTAIRLTVETLALSLAGYFIGDWTIFKTTVLAYPELILLTLVINYAIGKFAGLRLTEYIRFRNVAKHIRDAEKSR